MPEVVALAGTRADLLGGGTEIVGPDVGIQEAELLEPVGTAGIGTCTKDGANSGWDGQ